MDNAGIDILLVGDSVGMVVHGHDTTLPVTMEDMLLHCRAVSRGARRPFLLGDLPFGSFEAAPARASHRTAPSVTHPRSGSGHDAAQRGVSGLSSRPSRAAPTPLPSGVSLSSAGTPISASAARSSAANAVWCSKRPGAGA